MIDTNFWNDIHLGDSIADALAKSEAENTGEGFYKLPIDGGFFDDRIFHVENGIIDLLEAVSYCTKDPYGDFVRSTLKVRHRETLNMVFGSFPMALERRYMEGSLLVQPENFAEAIQKGELVYGYFIDPLSLSPSLRIAYKEDYPDKLVISAIIASPEFILRTNGQ